MTLPKKACMLLVVNVIQLNFELGDILDVFITGPFNFDST